MMGHLWSHVVLARHNVAMWSSLLTGNLKFLPWELHINCAWNTKLSDVPITPYTFKWWLVWILCDQLSIRTELFYVLCQSLEANSRIVAQLGHDFFPSNPFQVIIHEFSYQSTAYSVVVAKQTMKEAKMEFSSIS
jgi:hypothetical protein